MQAQVPAVTGYKVVSTKNPFGFALNDSNDATLMTVNLGGWAPAWKWVGIDPAVDNTRGLNGVFTFDAAAGTAISVAMENSSPSKNAVSYKYTLTSDKEVALTAIMTEILVAENQAGSSVTVTSGPEAINENLPITRADTVPNVSKAVFHLGSGDIVLDIDPPTPIAFLSRGFRLLLASNSFKAGTTKTTVTYTFPQPVVSASR